MTMIFRPATAGDFIALQGKPPESTVRAHVAEHDGQVLAAFGVYYTNGITVAFTIMGDGMRKHRKSIMRFARFVMAKIAAMPGPIYALCSRTEETAPRFLARLGFEFMSESDAGDLYKLKGA